MELAKYPIIVTVDADLENDPWYIPETWKRVKAGTKAKHLGLLYYVDYAGIMDALAL